MKKRKIDGTLFSDTLMCRLIQNQVKHQYSDAVEIKTNRLINEHYGKLSQRLFLRFLYSVRSMMLSPAGAGTVACVIFLCAVIGYVNFVMPPSTLSNPLVVSSFDDTIQNIDTVDKSGTIAAGADQKLHIQSDQALFVLEDSGSLSVVPGRRFDHYTLSAGTLFINADQLQQDGRLIIETPLGEVCVVGTQYSISVNSDFVMVECFDGIVTFQVNNQDASVYTVDKGRNLRARYDSDLGYIVVSEDSHSIAVPYRLKRSEDFLNEENSLSDNESSGPVDDSEKSEEAQDIQEELQQNWITTMPVMADRVLVLDSSIVTVSKSEMTVFDKLEGSIIRRIKLTGVETGFTARGDLLFYFPKPGKIRGISPLSGKVVFESETGPVAFSAPAVSENILVVASTDKNLYGYNYKTKEQLFIQPFSTGLHSTPLIIGERVLTGLLSKEVIVYSIGEGRVEWSDKQTNRLMPGQPVADKTGRFVAVTCEDGVTTIYSLSPVKKLFSIKCDTAITPVFVGQSLATVNGTDLMIYNMSGKKTATVDIGGKKYGLFVLNDILFAITENGVIEYEADLKERRVISLAGNFQSFDYSTDTLAVSMDENRLVSYSIIKEVQDGQ